MNDETPQDEEGHDSRAARPAHSVQKPTDFLSRIENHRRGLTLVHIAAFVGTGIAALGMDKHAYVPRANSRGAALGVFVSVLWVAWPFLVSLFVSKKYLPGRPLAVSLFVAILCTVTIVGGVLIDGVLSTGAPVRNAFGITLGEAVLLSYAARFLALMKV